MQHPQHSPPRLQLCLLTLTRSDHNLSNQQKYQTRTAIPSKTATFAGEYSEQEQHKYTTAEQNYASRPDAFLGTNFSQTKNGTAIKPKHAATVDASAAESPWAVATKPVFKQYGKLAVGFCCQHAQMAGTQNSEHTLTTHMHAQVRLGSTTDGLRPSGQFLRLNDDANPLKFETSLFYGRVVVRVKDAAGAPSTAYFQGVKRKMSVHFEGRFKKRICTNNVVVVAGFERKLVKLPTVTRVVVAKLHKVG